MTLPVLGLGPIFAEPFICLSVVALLCLLAALPLAIIALVLAHRLGRRLDRLERQAAG